MTIENNLKKLNISLPNAPDPVGAYVAFKKIGNLLFILQIWTASENMKILFRWKYLLKGKLEKI